VANIANKNNLRPFRNEDETEGCCSEIYMKFAMGMQMKKNAMSRINQIVASSPVFKPLFGNKLEQIGPMLDVFIRKTS